MTGGNDKTSLMRSLGAFVGEIVRAVKTDPQKYDRERPPTEVSDDDEVILRRTTTTTTVDEVRVRKDSQR